MVIEQIKLSNAGSDYFLHHLQCKAHQKGVTHAKIVEKAT